MLGGCLTEIAAVLAVAAECRVLIFAAGLGVGSAASVAAGLHLGAIPYDVRPDDRIPPQHLPVRPAK